MPLSLTAECHLFIAPHLKIGSTWIPPNLVNTKWICGLCPYSTDNDTVTHCSPHLGSYVEKDPEDSQLADGQEAHADGRIQEDAANVASTLSYCDSSQDKEKHLFWIAPMQNLSLQCAGLNSDIASQISSFQCKQLSLVNILVTVHNDRVSPTAQQCSPAFIQCVTLNI